MTAYEVRISDWSSDVCSSDLSDSTGRGAQVPLRHAEIRPGDGLVDVSDVVNKQGSRPPLWGFYCKRGAGNEEMIPCRNHRYSRNGVSGSPGRVVTGNRKCSVILSYIKRIICRPADGIDRKITRLNSSH